MASTPTTEPAPYPGHCVTIPLKAPDFCNVKNVHMLAAHMILHPNHWFFLGVLGSLFKVYFVTLCTGFALFIPPPSQVNIDTLRQYSAFPSPPPFPPSSAIFRFPCQRNMVPAFLCSAQYTNFTFIVSLLQSSKPM